MSLSLDFTSNQKVIAYAHNISTTITAMGVSFRDSSCYSLQASQLGETKVGFHPLAVYIAPNGTMKAIQ